MEGRPPEALGTLHPPESEAILGEMIIQLRSCLQILASGQVHDSLRDNISNGEDLFILCLKLKVF